MYNATSDWVCKPNLTSEILSVVEVLETYLNPTLLVFGILTNVLTLLTLRSSRLKESPYVYLTALVASYLVALIFLLIDNSIKDESLIYTIYRIRVYYPFTNMAATVGVNIMTVLTIERCVFIQYPLWAPFKCTVHRAKVHTGIAILFSFLINLPRFFWYHVTSYSWSTQDLEVQTSISVDLTPQTGPIMPIITWIHSAVHNFLPFLIMILLNPFMVYKVRMQQKKRGRLGVRNMANVTIWSREQLRLTTILIAIIFFFIVLVLPSAFADDPILRLIMGETDFADQGHIYQRISNMLMVLNLSGNFILYSFINSKFLKAFREMLAAWRVYLLRRCTCEGHQGGRVRLHGMLKRESSQAISLQLDSSLSSQPQA